MYNTGYNGWGIGLMIIICVVCLVVAVGLAFIPAHFAKKKGYSYVGFWIFGFFLFIPALIVALCINKHDTSQTLLNYKKLLDDGGITQEEYDKKKAELL